MYGKYQKKPNLKIPTNEIFGIVDNFLVILNSLAVSYGMYVDNEKRRLDFEIKSSFEKISRVSELNDILKESLVLLTRDISKSKLNKMPISIKTKNFSRSIKRKRNKVDRKGVK